MTDSANERLIVIDGPGDTTIRRADPEKVRQILERFGGIETWALPAPPLD